MVSEEEFLKVQEIIKKNPNGYKHKLISEDRPLTKFIYCECGRKMTGYLNKKKQLHYYKCQICMNATINANSSPKGMGANDLFVELLKSFELPNNLIDKYKTEVSFLISKYSANQVGQEIKLKDEMQKDIEKLKILKKRFAFGEINDDMLYNELRFETEARITQKMQEIEKCSKKISNHDNFINNLTTVLQNLNRYWTLGSVYVKEHILNLVFFDGLILFTKKRQYLTRKVNILFELSRDLTIGSGDIKKADNSIFLELSASVPEAGVEPAQACAYRFLRPARLPIPPFGHWN